MNLTDWTAPRVYKNPDGTPYACRIYDNGRTVCEVSMGHGRDHVATGHLISAAPALLAALETITARHAEAVMLSGYDPDTHPSIMAARAAIAKARGK